MIVSQEASRRVTRKGAPLEQDGARDRHVGSSVPPVAGEERHRSSSDGSCDDCSDREDEEEDASEEDEGVQGEELQKGFQKALDALEEVNKDLHAENEALKKELDRKDKALRKRELAVKNHGESIVAMMASHKRQRC